MPTNDQKIGQFIEWTHPDFDEFLILEPGDDPKGCPRRMGDSSLFRSEPVGLTREGFNILPEFTG